MSHGQRSKQSSARRAAFTLLELLLVLTILVMVGAMIVPRMTDLLERQRLNGAADLIKIRFEEARLAAMRSGQSQVFQCELNTRRFSIRALLQAQDSIEASDGAAIMSNGQLIETDTTNLGTTIQASDELQESSDELEERLTFLNCRVVSSMRSLGVVQDSQASGSTQVNQENQLQSIIFYPDGSTSTAEVQIQNERGEVRSIQMRGLTGSVRIEDIKNVASDEEASND